MRMTHKSLTPNQTSDLAMRNQYGAAQMTLCGEHTTVKELVLSTGSVSRQLCRLCYTPGEIRALTP